MDYKVETLLSPIKIGTREAKESLFYSSDGVLRCR